VTDGREGTDSRADEDAGDQLSLTFAALADPTRRAILARLAEGELTVNEIAKPYAMSLQAVSKHLKVLERAGLITSTQSAQRRPRKIQAQPLKAASDWLDEYRKLWDERFDRLDVYLKQLQKKEQKHGRKK
jgi:DNA-binding transcriptional ArsR family regulator